MFVCSAANCDHPDKHRGTSCKNCVLIIKPDSGLTMQLPFSYINKLPHQHRDVFFSISCYKLHIYRIFMKKLNFPTLGSGGSNVYTMCD